MRKSLGSTTHIASCPEAEMPSGEWSLGRILLIWVSWLLLLLAVFLLLGMNGWGFSLDLFHTPVWQWLVFAAVLLGPPMLATVAWGRR
jgi:hypothetical protein